MYLTTAILLNLFSIAFNTGMLLFNYFVLTSNIKYHYMMMNTGAILLGIGVITALLMTEHERKKLITKGENDKCQD